MLFWCLKALTAIDGRSSSRAEDAGSEPDLPSTCAPNGPVSWFGAAAVS